MKATIVFQQNWAAIHARNSDGSRKYRYIINTGSSRSSKTASLIQCCELYAREKGDRRITVWRDTKKDCRDTVLRDALTYFKGWPETRIGRTLNKTESIFTYANDSTFEIHGTDDEEKVMGLNKAVTWLNEPYKISRETFDQLDQRTEDFIIIDWNPKKSHWVEDVSKDPRAIVINSTFRDNPFCPQEQRLKILSYQPVSRCAIVTEQLLKEHEAKAYDVEKNPLGFSPKQTRELERCRQNEENRTANAFNWDVYGLGVKAEKPNRIFHWEEIPDEKYLQLSVKEYFGSDWGTLDPWGILGAKYYDGCLYLHERNYESEHSIRQKLSATERAIVMGAETEQEVHESTGIVTFVFNKLGIRKDCDVICDSNRPRKIAALRRAGWARAYPATKGPDSIRDGIDLLCNLRVYYTRSSANLKYEQENYSRTVDRYGVVLDEPEDENNHLMDPARYIAQHLQALRIIKAI